MGLLDQIKAVDDRNLVELKIPEWGFSVYLRPLSVRQKERLIDEQKKVGTDVDSISFADQMKQAGLLLRLCLTDETGQTILNSDEDLEVLKDKNANVFEYLCEQATKVNFKNIDEIIAELKATASE